MGSHMTHLDAPGPPEANSICETSIIEMFALSALLAIVCWHMGHRYTAWWYAGTGVFGFIAGLSAGIIAELLFRNDDEGPADRTLEWYGSELDPTPMPDTNPSRWMLWIPPVATALLLTALGLAIFGH